MSEPQVTAGGEAAGHGSSVERVVSALRDAIVRGEFAPGTRLIEGDIAATYAVSRTPVREAVRRLAGEGIVEVRPNHGAWVRQWDAAAVGEVFDLRAMLEAHAAALAAQHATPGDITRLTERCAGLRALESDPAEDRWDTYAVLNHAFHRDLCQVARSERLESILLGLLGIPLQHRSFGGRQQRAMERSNDHHDGIVEAVAAGEPEWAHDAMAAHVHATRRLLLTAWSEGDDGRNAVS